MKCPKEDDMTKSKTLGKLTVYSLATLICGVGQVAFAHTGVKDAAGEGVAGYTAFTITHGCTSNATPEGSATPAVAGNVIAQSVLFPNSADVQDSVVHKLGTVNGVAGVETGVLPDLSKDIVGVAPNTGFTGMGIGIVAGGGTLFPNIIPTINPTTKAIRGYATWAGPTPFKGAELQESIVSTTGLSPFKYGAIKFQPTSCAKSLKIRVAVANWCKRGAASKKKADRLDVWIGHTTAKFVDQLTMPRNAPYNAAIEAPFWPTLTVNRNTTTNPLPAGCDPATGYDLAIEPADHDIDAYLPIPTDKYPKGAGAGKFFE